jgi:hypothetical protein
MSIHESLEMVISDGVRKAIGEATARIDSKPRRFSAQKKTEIVLRPLRGEDLDLLFREFGVPASRITA